MRLKGNKRKRIEKKKNDSSRERERESVPICFGSFSVVCPRGYVEEKEEWGKWWVL